MNQEKYLEETIEVMIKGSELNLAEAKDRLYETIEEEYREANELFFENWSQKLEKAFLSQKKEQESWNHQTDNDKVILAFEELETEGIIAYELAGQSHYEGWEIRHELKSEDYPNAWGATFFTEQDLPSAFHDQELFLHFGVFYDPSESSFPEAKTVKLAETICKIMEKYELNPIWNNNTNHRIVLNSFNWQRRNLYDHK
jgi:hypothetical protein